MVSDGQRVFKLTIIQIPFLIIAIGLNIYACNLIAYCLKHDVPTLSLVEQENDLYSLVVMVTVFRIWVINTYRYLLVVVPNDRERYGFCFTLTLFPTADRPQKPPTFWDLPNDN
jgi:hypothetical protein